MDEQQYTSAPPEHPLFPDVPASKLPEILRVDKRTLDHLRADIYAALHETTPRALRLNAAQKKFILEYVRFCVEQNRTSLKSWLAAAGLHLMRHQSDQVYEATRSKLESNATIAAQAALLNRVPDNGPDFVADEIAESGKEPDAVIDTNSLQDSQKALRLENYEHAVMFAERALNAKPADPDVQAHAALCFLMRVGKAKIRPGEYEIEHKIADTYRCLECCRAFIKLSKDIPKYAKLQTNIQSIMQQAAKMQGTLLKK